MVNFCGVLALPTLHSTLFREDERDIDFGKSRSKQTIHIEWKS
jgi:hypothetical protein